MAQLQLLQLGKGRVKREWLYLVYEERIQILRKFPFVMIGKENAEGNRTWLKAEKEVWKTRLMDRLERER